MDRQVLGFHTLFLDISVIAVFSENVYEVYHFIIHVAVAAVAVGVDFMIIIDGTAGAVILGVVVLGSGCI